MKIQDLFEYNGEYYDAASVERLKASAEEAISHMEESLQQEDEAKIYLGDVSVAVVGFKNDVLGQRVKQVLSDTIYQ